MHPIEPSIALTTNYPKPKPKVLHGQYCVLQPFDKNIHALALYKAFLLDNEGVDWAYLPYGPFYSESAFFNWVDNTCCNDDSLFYTICIGRHLAPVGIVSLLNSEPNHGKTEIGHVHFSPKLQQTAASTETLYLLMQFVFAELGYRRLEWKCDNANERSKYCAKRLGFILEGVFRQHWIIKSRNRDTAWFSIIDNEWPDIELTIKRWLDPDNFKGTGQQIKRLSDF